MNGPRILLVIGGGIAAYKSCELVRLIRKGGGEVTCVLTDGGAQFVTAMALAALSENPVHTSLWDLRNEVEIGHIQLSRAADLVVVCPATADLMARMAAGIADDLATTLLLATDKPVLAVPAMNVRMWQHAATVRNVQTLRDSGVVVMPPDEGMMACGEYGPGRLPEPAEVWREIARLTGMDAGLALPAFAAAAMALATDPVELPVPAAMRVPDDEESDEDPGGEGLGGLSGTLISRGRRQPDMSDGAGSEADPTGWNDQEWGGGEWSDLPYPEAELPAEEPLPPLNLDSPLLSKKGKARAAPPTDPQAINHLVSGGEGAVPPEPIAGDTHISAHHNEDAVLDGQPDFDAEPEHRPLYGRHVLITAGPTHEAIDPVRYIANRSSGKQGFAIAAAAAAAGAQVTLVSGPVHLPTPPGVDRVDVESAVEMAAAVKDALPADVAIMVAAVADWRSDRVAHEKIKKRGSAPPALLLTENPDILATVAGSRMRPKLLVGFAAETDNVLEHATEKRKRKGADWIVANDVSGDVMGGERNTVHIVSSRGVESLPDMPKDQVARALVERIADALA